MNANNADHVHDCCNADQRCVCGFKLVVQRFCVSFEVYDNQTKRTVVDDAFNTDSHDLIAEAFERAAEKVLDCV